MGNTRGLTDKPITKEVIVDPLTGKVVAAHLSTVVTDPTSADAVVVPDKFEYPTANATAQDPLNVHEGVNPADALDPDEGTGTNEVQTITDTPTITSGTFKLTFRGEQTAAIAYNATIAQVQAALVLLATVGKDGEKVDNVTVTGGPLPGTDTVITFRGDLGFEDVPAITVDNSALVGGTLAVAETTKGIRADAP